MFERVLYLPQLVQPISNHLSSRGVCARLVIVQFYNCAIILHAAPPPTPPPRAHHSTSQGHLSLHDTVAFVLIAAATTAAAALHSALAAGPNLGNEPHPFCSSPPVSLAFPKEVASLHHLCLWSLPAWLLKARQASELSAKRRKRQRERKDAACDICSPWSG